MSPAVTVFTHCCSVSEPAPNSSLLLLPIANLGQLQGFGVFGLRRNGCTGTAVAQTRALHGGCVRTIEAMK